eukprot:CAMPEP_0119308280 /NCGR_PEP_ID=MMETSP1333-20130426/9913_1 /TAXON_ID=418940 /ORGANISM="Scyphosphaera apsteinii, Strain RCC1455" /LENGTH=162 /DNA_ID=CAMNT_0007312011 /DNA_START=25 /DNA_END=511 /DNA_ORIENTATION=+
MTARHKLPIHREHMIGCERNRASLMHDREHLGGSKLRAMLIDDDTGCLMFAAQNHIARLHLSHKYALRSRSASAEACLVRFFWRDSNARQAAHQDTRGKARVRAIIVLILPLVSWKMNESLSAMAWASVNTAGASIASTGIPKTSLATSGDADKAISFCVTL